MRKNVLALSLAFLTIALMVSQTSVQGALLSPIDSWGTQALDTSRKSEFLTVIAGIDDAALVQISTFGALAESDYPITIGSELSSALAWTFYVVDQSDYASYLVRKPLEAPDGAVLAIVYPNIAGTKAMALQAASLFEAEYSITLYPMGVFESPSQKVYMFVGGDASTLMGSMLDDVIGFGSSGFNGLVDKTTVSNAPVKAAGYGAISINMGMGPAKKVSFQGVMYVDANAITGTGTDADPFVLSTQSLFGQAISPRTDSFLSRVRFNFPYVISVVPNGIIPAQTTNPVPQLTGSFIWDLKHPNNALSLGSQADMKVIFTVPANGISQFPMVRGNLFIDNSKLNVDNTLDVNVVLENLGNAEAKNIEVAHPLGDALSFLVSQDIKARVLKQGIGFDSGVLNANLSLQVDLSGSIQDGTYFYQKLIQLMGWYVNTTDSSLLDWDYSNNQQNVLTIDLAGGAGILTFTLKSDQGMPTFVVNAISSALSDVFSGYSPSLTDIASGDIFGGRGAEMFFSTVNSTYWAIQNQYYEEKSFFNLDAGNFTVETTTIAPGTPYERDEVVLRASVASLAPGENVTLNWKLTDVPGSIDRFVLPEVSAATYFQPTSGGGGYNATFVKIAGGDYGADDLFRYVFYHVGFSGRFATLPAVPDDMKLWMPETDVEAQLSVGGVFSYEDANGFGYFGLTNGVNFQYGDDEAVLVTKLQANGTIFNPGDGVKFTAEIENTGDAAASDVTVYFYHAQLDRGWRLRRISLMGSVTAPDITAGGTATVEFETVANSYLGFHPVFAVVEFTSEAGQPAKEIVNFANTSDPLYWADGGETKQFTISNLIGGLLQGTGGRQPAFPQPNIVQETQVSEVDTDTNQFTYTITVRNDGDAASNVTIVQYFNQTEVSFVSATVSGGGTGSVDTSEAMYRYETDQILLEPGDSVTVTITFELLVSYDIVLPPVIVVYTSLYESELGDRPVTGLPGFKSGGGGGTGLLGLNAEAAATGSAEEQATGKSDYTAYSSSTSVGANIATQNTQGDVRGRQLFTGSNELALVAILGTAGLAFLKRRKR